MSVAALFPGLGSVVPELTLAVFVMLEPPGTEASTLTTSDNATVAPLTRLNVVLVTVPVAPTAGVVLTQPGEKIESDTKVVLDGSGSENTTLAAELGPLLETKIV